MEKNNLSNEQSLKIITDMIEIAKGNISNVSVFFIIWGWIVFSACIGSLVILKFTGYEQYYHIWIPAIAIGIILSAIYGYKLGKREKTKTHLNFVYGCIWIAFGISYTICLFFLAEINYNIDAIVLVLAGNSTFLSGMVIRFKPLIYGGIALWIGSILIFLVKPEEFDLLLGGVSILFGYLIPAYMLKTRQKNGSV